MPEQTYEIASVQTSADPVLISVGYGFTVWTPFAVVATDPATGVRSPVETITRLPDDGIVEVPHPAPGSVRVFQLYRTEDARNLLDLGNDQHVDVRDLQAQFDSHTRSLQQLEQLFRDGDEGIRWTGVAVTAPDVVEIPAAGARADAVLGFDGAGDPAMLPLGTTGAELLEADDAATARGSLGVYSTAQADAAIAASTATVTAASLGVYTIAETNQAVSDAQSSIEGSLPGLVASEVATAIPAQLFGEGKAILSDADLRVVGTNDFGFDMDDSGAVFLWGGVADGEVELPEYLSERKTVATVRNGSAGYRLKIVDGIDSVLLPTGGVDARWIPPGGVAALVHLGGGDWIVFGLVEEE